MGQGQWREERYLPAPAQDVFDGLVNHLKAHHCQIVRADPELRGVTALPAPNVRVAVAVDDAGEGRSRIELESGPAFGPESGGESRHRRVVLDLLATIEELLGLPEQGDPARRLLPAGPRATCFDGWREGRFLPAAVDAVRDELLDRLAMLGYKVEPSKPDAAHITAYRRSLATGIRVVAEVYPAGERRSRVIIESEPGGFLDDTDESLHRRNVEHLFTKIEETLTWRPDDLEPEGRRDS